MIRRAIIYNRISSPSQIGRDGLVRQSAVNHAYARAAGLKVFAEISICESGSSLRDQHGLNAALNLCRAHRALLLVESHERLTRSGETISGPIVFTSEECRTLTAALYSIVGADTAS